MRHRRGAPAIHTVLVIAAVTCLGACAPAFPPVAAGPGGDAAFKARIATLYPPGSSGVALGEDLARQGFTIAADPVRRRYTAIEAPDNLPCYSVTRLRWTEDRRGRIVEIGAERHLCN